MAVVQRTSHNFHDSHLVVADLLQDLPSSASAPGSIALLTLDSQLNTPEILRLLGERVAVPIVGGTTGAWWRQSV